MIDLLSDFEDYNKVSTFIKAQTDETLSSNESFIKYSKKCNLFNLVMILKAANMTNCLPSLVNENIQHFSKNIKDNFSLLNLLFIKDVGNIKYFKGENESFNNILEAGTEEDLNQKNKISMNISNISLKVDANQEESSFIEKEEELSRDMIKTRNRNTSESNINLKIALNFNENVLESLINFFKVIVGYSAALLRFFYF